MAAAQTRPLTFFEGQALARRNTRLLVILYVVAVVAVIIAVDLVIAAAWIYGSGEVRVPRGARPSFFVLLKAVPVGIYLAGAALTALVIFCVSGYEVLSLADGGSKVAEMVGARRVSQETRDPLEKRLLNVVEEMSIASGVRLPKVYVMDGERGINAFAAGYDMSDSVVAVTRGTLETLNRDELQAVIAHEFSHILNGDMRLNIRMMGVLAGIVFLGAIGEFLMRSARGKNGAPIFLSGLAILIIGYVGLFAARVIKAAVSRQREFLADASSVQFTRNPDGIAGALDQIQESSAGSLIESRHAEDMSHMFFGQGIKVMFGSVLDTHPPLKDRIKAAHPRFDRSAYRSTRARSQAEADILAQPGADIGTGFGKGPAAGGPIPGVPIPGLPGIPGMPNMPGGKAAAMAGFAGVGAPAAGDGRRTADTSQEWGRSAGESARVVGTVDAGKLDYARQLIAGLPAGLRERIHEPTGACAAILALLLAPKDEVMEQQLAAAKAVDTGKIADIARALAPATRRLGPAFHLPLLDLALPAVKAASAELHHELVHALKAVIQADRRVSLHEFVVLTLVRSQLVPTGKPASAGSSKLGELKDDALKLLQLVAHAGTRADASGERQQALEAATRAGLSEMGLAHVQVPPAGTLSMDTVADSLERLKKLAPMQKALLVKGLFATVTHDGTINVTEAELMRMVAAVLECPLPPLLTDIDPATLAA